MCLMPHSDYSLSPSSLRTCLLCPFQTATSPPHSQSLLNLNTGMEKMSFNSASGTEQVGWNPTSLPSLHWEGPELNKPTATQRCNGRSRKWEGVPEVHTSWEGDTTPMLPFLASALLGRGGQEASQISLEKPAHGVSRENACCPGPRAFKGPSSHRTPMVPTTHLSLPQMSLSS